jgi:hypothetical protein
LGGVTARFLRHHEKLFPSFLYGMAAFKELQELGSRFPLSFLLPPLLIVCEVAFAFPVF